MSSSLLGDSSVDDDFSITYDASETQITIPLKRTASTSASAPSVHARGRRRKEGGGRERFQRPGSGRDYFGGLKSGRRQPDEAPDSGDERVGRRGRDGSYGGSAEREDDTAGTNCFEALHEEGGGSQMSQDADRRREEVRGGNARATPPRRDTADNTNACGTPV